MTAKEVTHMAHSKRNVLFIMSDQHNAHALGCYGNAQIETPHLDHLATQGVVFDRAFCQTGQCCPSRYSIWTGRYARSHGLYWNGMMEDAEETTVGDLFKSAGYVTANIGKHHMHMAEVPDKHGFDHIVDRRDYTAFVRSERVPAFHEAGEWLPDHVHPGRAHVGTSEADNDHHPTGFWASETIDFLRKHRDNPFCLFCSFYGPHTPIAPSRPWAALYDPLQITLPPNNDYAFPQAPGLAQTQAKSGEFTAALHRETLAYYYGLVSQMDHNIGRVLQELDTLGLFEHTVVVYTSDHGDMMGEHGAWTKGVLGYDATIRVPLIVRSPGTIPAGKRVRELAALIDLLPTLLDLTDQDIPRDIQGRSLASLAAGHKVAWPAIVFSEIGRSISDQVITARACTDKYVLFRRGGIEMYEQFFNLERDPWEMRNEVENQDYSERVDELRAALADWEARTETKPTPEIVGF
jgi:arylsulfatase A-like enzyme